MKKKLILLSVLVFLSTLTVVTAQSPGDTGGGTPATPIDIGAILTRFRTFILWPIFSGLVIIMFLWAGFLYLTAKGEPSKIQMANKAVVWGTVGVAVGILAYSAYKLVSWLILGAAATP